MELEVRNLGRIREARVELRPLTVFVGPNHTNKTWLAAAAYAALSAVAIEGRLDGAALTRRAALLRPSVLSGFRADLERAVADRSGTSHVIRLETETVVVADEASRSLAIQGHELTELLGDAAGDATCTLKVGVSDLRSVDGAVVVVDTQPTGDAGLVRIETPEPVTRLPFRGATDARFLDLVAELVVRRLVAATTRVVALPVDRVGVVPRHAVGMAARYREWLDATTAVLREPRIPEVSAVLSGSVARDEIGRVTFTFPGAPPLDVQVSASLVRSLHSLELYLASFATTGDWIVIDEPEMNAHPLAQLKIAELLALLVMRGWRVLFTTHSPYITDQLSNLMAAFRVSQERRAGLESVFALGSAEAFLDPARVAAYEFREDGDAVRVVDVLDRETATIDNRTFGAQTERLADIYNAILDRS